MLQQTRVAAVVPYYERFLVRFPNVRSLANASTQEVLTYWSGLGYYSRARNLHKAAHEITKQTLFPESFQEIRSLPGVGDYTAAAIASIAFNLPHAVVDGNVRRVLSRLLCAAGDIRNEAQALLDRRHPGEFNQALMELGATICLPNNPNCPACPVSPFCLAQLRGCQHEYPPKLTKQTRAAIKQTILLIRRGGKLLLYQRPPEAARMPGFWELPLKEQIPTAALGPVVGTFRHSITVTDYTFEARQARIVKTPLGFHWVNRDRLAAIPLSTITRKALDLTPETRVFE